MHMKRGFFIDATKKKNTKLILIQPPMPFFHRKKFELRKKSFNMVEISNLVGTYLNTDAIKKRMEDSSIT